MTIRHLRIFIAVADAGKMSLAAKHLYLAQPTVSQAIGELEQHYGCKLFERLSKKLYITPAGTRLLGYARHIVAQFDDMEADIKQTSQAPRLTIGATMTVGACVLSGIVSRFEGEHPAARCQLYIDNTREIEARLLKSELDLAIVEGQVQSRDLQVHPLFRDELILVCPPGHPLAQRSRLNLCDLQDQPFILREEGSGTRALFMQSLAENGISIEAKWVCHGPESIKSALLAGQGMTVISRRLVQAELDSGFLVQLPLQDARLTRFFSLVYHKNKFISPTLCLFFTQCNQICAEQNLPPLPLNALQG